MILEAETRCSLSCINNSGNELYRAECNGPVFLRRLQFSVHLLAVCLVTYVFPRLFITLESTCEPNLYIFKTVSDFP